jgi:hypothetical protein
MQLAFRFEVFGLLIVFVNDLFCVLQNGCEDVLVYGTGLYSFFNSWDQGCLSTDNGSFPNCQLNLNTISSDSKVGPNCCL